jgi:hypothetical protein
MVWVVGRRLFAVAVQIVSVQSAFCNLQFKNSPNSPSLGSFGAEGFPEFRLSSD